MTPRDDRQLAARGVRALVVDDEPDIRQLLSMTLERMGVECLGAETLEEAKRLAGTQALHLCLTDVRLPDGDGVSLVEYLRERHADLPVVVITAYGNAESAVRALKAGAFDYLGKPVDLEQLRNLVASALNLHVRDSAATGHLLVGDSPPIRALLGGVEKVARSQAPVYIGGESGVGKELVARIIHERGPRAAEPFVPVNCGAVPHELIESELFGHKKGSFTGATADREGLFQAADRGTLFLDEVADLPLPMQVKLLRAIQERSIRPIGGQREIPVNVRILSATHRSLERLLAEGRFRQDLYYRIHVIELQVPPLRERRGDIPLLVEHFRHRIALRSGRPVPSVQPDALEVLAQYDYPGNVRELENILERAATWCDGRAIRRRDLRLPEPGPAAGAAEASLGDYLSGVERDRILAALERTRWNRTRAARLLGISLRALRYRLEKLGLTPPAGGPD